MFSRIGIVLALGALLTGCSREPSEADIRAAYLDNLSAVQSQMGQLTALTGGALGDLQINLVDLRKLSCEEDGKAYRCTTQVTLEVPLLGEQRKTEEITLMKSDSGWVMLDK